MINVKWAKDRYLPLDGSVNSTNNFGAINKQYVDTGFLKLSGGTITGRLYLHYIVFYFYSIL